MNQNELMHYGVLGMKWGVRKTRSYTQTNTKKSSKNTKSKIKRNVKIGAAATATAIGVIGGVSIAKHVTTSREVKAIARILRDNGSDPLELSEQLIFGRRGYKH